MKHRERQNGHIVTNKWSNKKKPVALIAAVLPPSLKRVLLQDARVNASEEAARRPPPARSISDLACIDCGSGLTDSLNCVGQPCCGVGSELIERPRDGFAMLGTQRRKLQPRRDPGLSERVERRHRRRHLGVECVISVLADQRFQLLRRLIEQLTDARMFGLRLDQCR